MTGEPDQTPVRLPIAVNDLGAGMWAVIGIQSALIARSASGLGCCVKTSLFETAAWWMNYHLTSYLATGDTPVRAGTGTPWLAPYEVFQASDEGLMVCAGNDNLFHKFVDVLELPSLATDERFLSNPLRVKNRAVLREIILNRFRDHAAEEWEVLLKAQSIPCSRVQTVADLAQEEQLDALGIMTEYPHPLIPNLRLINSPVSLNGTRSVEHKPPPLLGEHTDTILSGLGYSEAEIKALRERKIVD
jgi:formyl-CoA transferase/CoA:oxalate CoA-transferase